jgi:hypothetical protein
MSDVFHGFNECNMRLQGQKVTLIDGKRVVSSLIQKFTIFKSNIAHRSFQQFPVLAGFVRESSVEPDDDELMIYVTHLEKLIGDMEMRFADLLQLQIPDWVLTLENLDLMNYPADIQEELIEVQNDEEVRVAMKNGFSSAWLHFHDRYPKLFVIAQPLLLTFPTSYMVEASFSHVVMLLSKQRNRLDIVQRGDLRLKLTNFSPCVLQLSKNIQGQGSH